MWMQGCGDMRVQRVWCGCGIEVNVRVCVKVRGCDSCC